MTVITRAPLTRTVVAAIACMGGLATDARATPKVRQNIASETAIWLLVSCPAGSVLQHHGKYGPWVCVHVGSGGQVTHQRIWGRDGCPAGQFRYAGVCIRRTGPK